MLGTLPSGWDIVSFESVLLGGTRNGIYKPKLHHGSGAKIVNMGELFAHRRLHAIAMKRLRVTQDELERFELHQGDLLFARRSLVAEGAGKCTLVCEVDEPTVFESSIIRARPDPEIADSAFLFYLFSSPYGSHAMGAITRQVAVAGITGRDLAALSIPLPPLTVQRRIAGILGAIDDKIELNRRMNLTLESIACAVFKSWFIDFDPVRKKMEGGEVGLPPDLAALFPSSLAERENGDVPQGWSLGTLGDVGVRIRSQARPEELESGTPYFGLEHLPRRSIALSDWGVADGVVSAKSRFVAGDLLFGKLRPYFHKVGPAPVDGVCSTDIVVVRPRRPTLGGFVLGHLSSAEFVDYASATSSGTRMPRTNWKDMAAYPVVMPPNDVVEALEAAVSGLLQRIRNNILESRRLAEARDALLPNLLSGELRSLTKTAPLEAR